MTSGKEPITTFVVYTIVKADEVKVSFLNTLSGILGDEMMQAEFFQYINTKGYVILELKRIVDQANRPSAIRYELSGFYRIMIAPADHGPEFVHITQLDNDSFLEHLLLVKTSKYNIS